ncbi:MAG: DUF935 domain-containing protein [Pseudonocardia sp.]|nr:DUF935 domain-containing protein [Pseudonocardia sp.]
MPTTEIGRAVTVSSLWAQVRDEPTPELRWPRSLEKWNQMRRQDAQVASVLRAVTLPVRRTPWRIDPAGARDEVVELVAADLGLPIVGADDLVPVGRSEDRFSWTDHLRHALLSLTFGHMAFEQIYRVDHRGPGGVHLRKLGPRMPRTLTAVNVADDGGLVSIEQLGVGRPIPVDRLVMYTHDREGGNWIGSSLLRPAYKFWVLKDRLLRLQAQTIERNGMGVPVYEAAEREQSLEAGEKLAKEHRSGESAGAAIPFGAKLRFQGVEGALPDAEPVIRYYDEQIARNALGHFLNLGTQTGSWALGTTFADFFTLSLQTVAQDIADVTNQHVVEDLVDVNWGVEEPAPRLVFDEIGSRHAATAEAIKLLVDAGALSRDPQLEQHLRQMYGLPARSGDAPPAGPPGSEEDS